MAEQAENLDSLILGSVSEGVAESDEQFSERLRATQAKLAAIKKDEKKSKNFDQKLSKIIPSLTSDQLDMVILLINHDIPSLTILSVISIINEESAQICYVEFHKYIEEKADFSVVKFGDPKIEERIGYWWTFILAANHLSTTIKFRELRENEDFIRHLSRGLTELLISYLKQNEVHEFDHNSLKHLVTKYQEMIFSN